MTTTATNTTADPTRVIMLRLPQSEYDNLRAAAKLHKKSMNQLLRELAKAGSTDMLESAICRPTNAEFAAGVNDFADGA